MSRLSKFCGKPEEIEIQGEKFKMYPLKGKHLHLFANENASAKEQQEIAQKIIYYSLKPSEPDITMEEVENLQVSILNDLLMKAMEVNGMEKDERVEKIKRKINKQKQKK